jgi:hypothetical protein
VAQWREPGDESVPAELLEFRESDWTWRLEPNHGYYPHYGWPAFKTPLETWRSHQIEWLRQDPTRRIRGADAVDIIFADRG